VARRSLLVVQPTVGSRKQTQPHSETGDIGSRRLVAPELPGRVRRIRFRLLRRRLDRRIAADAPPADSVDIRSRCAELTARDSRLALACALVSMVDAAEERRADSASALILDHEAVWGERDLIEAVIVRLRGDETVSARGVALVRLLVLDSRGPLYHHRDGTALHDALARIGRAL
jgi:hypothetical protein